MEAAHPLRVSLCTTTLIQHSKTVHCVLHVACTCQCELSHGFCLPLNCGLYSTVHAFTRTTYQTGCLAGSKEVEPEASMSGSDESGQQLVFIWQAGQPEAHYTEAVSGAQVYRSTTTPLVFHTQLQSVSVNWLFFEFAEVSSLCHCRAWSVMPAAYVTVQKQRCMSSSAMGLWQTQACSPKCIRITVAIAWCAGTAVRSVCWGLGYSMWNRWTQMPSTSTR